MRDTVLDDKKESLWESAKVLVEICFFHPYVISEISEDGSLQMQGMKKCVKKI